MLLFREVLLDCQSPQSMYKATGCAEALGSRVSQAQKFVLENDTVAAISQVSRSKPSSLIPALPLARPPYQLSWIEFDSRPRAAHGAAEDNVDSNHPETKRVGYLIEAGDDCRHGRISLLWNYSNFEAPQRSVMSPFQFWFDFREFPTLLNNLATAPTAQGEALRRYRETMRSEPDLPHLSRRDNEAIVAISDVCPPVRSDYLSRIWDVMDNADPIERKEFDKNSFSDIAGEAGFILATLCMLNSRSNIEFEERNVSSSSSRKRLSKGRQPLYSHHIVKIALRPRQSIRLEIQGSSQAQIRAHLVRGHFKVRKSGIYWWMPFVRGSAKHGVISKDYEVHPGTTDR